MKVRELVRILAGHDDMEVAVMLYFKEDVESLADRKFTDVEWAWLANDLISNHTLDWRDMAGYLPVLDEAIADGSVNAGGGRDV